MSSNRRNRWAAALGLTLALASSASFALTVPYFGTQGPKPDFQVPTPPPLSPAVSTQVDGFNGAITLLGSHGFEGVTPSTNFSYTGGTASLTAGVATIINGDNISEDQREQGRYNMTPGVTTGAGRPSFGHWLEATGDFTFTFSSAVSAFGFYGTDFGDFNGIFSIEFLSGGSRVFFNTLANDGENGNLLFFGLSSSEMFDSVIFHITQGSDPARIDVLGFDSFIVGTANAGTAVPEPGSLALVGLALAGIGATAGRARRARRG